MKLALTTLHLQCSKTKQTPVNLFSLSLSESSDYPNDNFSVKDLVALAASH